MLDIGSYTKEEIASELNCSAAKACNITRALANLGYNFSTSGKGKTYRICILSTPTPGLKEFAQECLGISARYEEKLTYFLYLLLKCKDLDYANMTAGSLKWFAPLSDDTIQSWLKSLISCGLLLEEPLGDSYYATKKEIITMDDETGDYRFIRKWKEITPTQYNQAIAAYNAVYREYHEGLDKNPDMAADELMFYASQAKKEALDGWWPNRKSSGVVVINEKWERYEELMKMLDNYNFEIYIREEKGNAVKDQEAWEKRVAAWEEEKAEKRRRLEEAEMRRKVAAAATKKTELIDLSDMPVFTNFMDAMKYIDDTYYDKKISLRKEVA